MPSCYRWFSDLTTHGNMYAHSGAHRFGVYFECNFKFEVSDQGIFVLGMIWRLHFSLCLSLTLPPPTRESLVPMFTGIGREQGHAMLTWPRSMAVGS